MKVLFVCWANVGRSQMAKALYNKFTNSDDADSAGTGVYKEQPNAKTMGERDIELSVQLGGEYISRTRKAMLDIYGLDIVDSPRMQLSPEIIPRYDLVVNIAERFQTPDWLRGENVIWWDIKDPGLKKNTNAVTSSLIEIERRIQQLIKIEKTGGDFHELDDNIDV